MIWAVRRPNPCSLINPESPVIECNAEICADRRHSCRRRTRPSGRLGRTETISLDRWADRDFPRDGTVLPPSAGLCRAAGAQSRRHRHVQRGRQRLVSRAARQGRGDAAGLGACRARGARRPEARYRPDPRRGAALCLGGGDFARDRGRRPHRRGDPGDCRQRYRQADRRRRQRRGHPGARAAAHRADAAGVPVRCDSRCPSPRGARGPQRFHR